SESAWEAPMPEADTEVLLDRAAAGDDAARGQLWQRHRDRLKRMVAVRADPRLAARVDPSDVVQETLAQANARLDAYLRTRPLHRLRELLGLDCGEGG